jgi:hypothetical protein
MRPKGDTGKDIDVDGAVQTAAHKRARRSSPEHPAGFPQEGRPCKWRSDRRRRDPQTEVFLKAVKRDEAAHVRALKNVLGSKAIKKPKFDFHGDNAHESRFVKASYTFENEGVHAYSGQAFNIKDPGVLAAALSIVTVEARHASVIGLILKDRAKGITPDGAFDTPFTANHVLRDVKSLHYIQG